MESWRIHQYIWILVIILPSLILAIVNGAPTLEATPLEPLLALSGDAVLIDCVVKNLNNYTIIWRRVIPGSNKTEIISAGEVRIISDSRFALLHQPGHETWVLQIRPAQVNDSGRYICEVNTNPRMQIFRLLTVVERIATVSSKAPLVDHNYTDCCVHNNVPSNCREFCSLQSVIMGGHPNPWQCMDHLPVITRCLTDGRNHMPCCVKQNIPEVCRSVCAGDYGLTTVLQHYSCMDYTLPTLTCIAEGIELLPGPPQEVTAEVLSYTEIKVTWSPPSQNIPVTTYQLNVTLVTELGFLDESEMMGEKKKAYKKQDVKATTVSPTVKNAMSVVIDGNETSYVMSGLQALTMYEIQMASKNDHGSSMPTYAVRVLTLTKSKDMEQIPSIKNSSLSLPNITSCCEKKGVPEGRCLTGLCDPSSNEDVKISDILTCAPWVNVTFECMAGGVDHSQCCQQRGLPEICLDFCKGNISNVDYRHFACLEHIDIFGNCLLEFYGVLPGPPESFLVTTVHSNWAVVRWKAPKFLPHTVEGYTLYWKEVVMDEITEYNIITDVKSPYLLDNLKPRTRYEVYVTALNEYGMSRGSARAVFTSAPIVNTSDYEKEVNSVYNETACCIAAGLKKGCLDLCSYKMKMSDLQLLAIPCADQLETLVRCGAGGRDHTPCCQRQGVRWECLPICSSVLEMTPQTAVSTCVADAGKIIQCMSEGVNQIPPAPEHLHATNILPTRVHIKWDFQSSLQEDPVWFEIRYTETKDQIPPHPLDYGYVKNSTETEEALKGLKSDIYYSIYVVAMNKHGSSTPSLVLVVHTPEREEIYNETISATLGPPNSLEVTHQTMDTVTLIWRSPYHLPAETSLSYLVFYQPANLTSALETSSTKSATTMNSITLNNLTVNTQYAIAIKAITGEHQSVLSETVLAWTDPAIPAFLNPPVVVPPLPIIEGANVTLLCVATGMPIPVVSLFLNGQLMVQQQQSHVALAVSNIQHNITKVDCFADNGLGQGAQSSMKLEVSFQPSVIAMDKVISAEEGSMTTLKCMVSGHPEPRILWYRDRRLREPLTRGSDLDMSIKPNDDKEYSYLATLTLPGLTTTHEGQYFCHAENQFGKDTILMYLNVLPKLFTNASACCEEKGVSKDCLDACAVDIDIETALNKPKCFKELDKLMYCAADGSDHRKCCRDRGIQRSCLRWCQGRPIVNTHLCILRAPKIIGCFEEGKAVLPGPPQNIKSHRMSMSSLEISWDMPQKNPKVVQWYKVFWRPLGSRTTYRNHTKLRTITLDNLEIGTTYEIVVKAGNHYGISLHSEPITFTLAADGSSPVLSERSSYGVSPVAKTTAGVIGAALVLIIGGAIALFFYQRSKKKPPPGISPGVSFENPTYMRDNSVAQNPVNLNSVSEANHCDNKKNENAQI